MESDVPSFPPGFVFGAATSAYQIEGGAAADGRGESIWDRFSHTPGRVHGGDTGDVAADHYHRYAEDIALMREIGLTAYRFSIAWPRIVPDGRGRVNAAGLDYYDRLVDGLLAVGIAPYATLYHWDLPQALQDAGGWADRRVVDAFVRYADVVSRRLGDRVQQWMTINEPWCISFLGHLTGEQAPGVRDLGTALRVAHHVLLAHGAAVPVLRANAGPTSQVGIVCNMTPGAAASDTEADRRAAERWDGFFNRWFVDPLAGRGYPSDMVALYGPLAPAVEPGDLERIATPVDFFGLNYYFRAVVSDDPDAPPLGLRSHEVPGATSTAMGWEVYPDGLRELLVRLHRDYGFDALYVTESGAAFEDRVDPGGIVRDPERLAYLRDHLAAARRAIDEGVPLGGFFVWSLLDNFEWAHGYAKRFGLIHVDYATQERRIKESGRWYAEIIHANSR